MLYKPNFYVVQTICYSTVDRFLRNFMLDFNLSARDFGADLDRPFDWKDMVDIISAVFHINLYYSNSVEEVWDVLNKEGFTDTEIVEKICEYVQTKTFLVEYDDFNDLMVSEVILTA